MVDSPTGFLNPNWLPPKFLTGQFGEGLPGQPWFLDPMNPSLNEGAYFTEPPPVKGGFMPDWHNKEYAKEFPVWQPGAFTNISPPSRNAGFSMPPGEKNVRGPWTAMGQTWREAPGEKDRPDPLTPQQVAVSNEIMSRGHEPQHIYDIYSATTKVDAAGEPVLPLERVHSQKQQDLAGRIINESIAAARETRPELFTETLLSGGRSLGPGGVVGGPPPSDQILPSQSAPNEILPQPASGGSILPSRFSNLPPLRSRYPGLYEPSGIEAPLVTYGEAVDRPGGHQDVFDFSEQQLGPLPPEAPRRLGQEVSGEQRYTPDVPSPADQLAAYEEYGIDPTDIVGGSFFSGPNQTGELVNPGSGFRYSDNVLKGAVGGPFSEWGALAREGADWQKYVGPAMTAAVGSQIPGAGLLGLFAAGLNKLGAYHRFNPAADSNLFADPETGRATWGTTDPGGSGSQRGTLNLYNMLQDFGGSYPNRQVQTPSRRIYPEDGPSYEIPQYANARDLAYIRGQGDRPPQGLYTQQTPLGYQDFGGNVTNQEALNTYNRTGAGAILNEAGAILGPDAGYNATRDMAESMAENLQDQMDYSDQDWGDWI